MNRNFCATAIVLSLKTLGENNFLVTLQTKEKGIVFATLYGGPKSKLKSLVSLWNSGKVWLYENPEKNQIKISDFEVQNYHNSFSQNLFKMYAASLAAELSIKTKCAGSSEECFKIVSGFFDGMELCNEEQSRLGLIRFLWRYLELMGVQPSAHDCGGCGESFFDQQFENHNISYYNVNENCFTCSDCGGNIPIKTSAIKYLWAISVLQPAEVRKMQIDEESYLQIKQVVFFLIEHSLEQKLNSIETGVGIL